MIVGGSELWRDVDTNTVFTKNTKVYAWSTTRMYQDTGHNAFCSGSNHNHTHVSGYDSSGRANWHIYSDDGTFTGWGRLYYYWEETRTIPATYETQYRYRDLITP